MLVHALLIIQIPGALVVLGMFLPYSLAKACYDPDASAVPNSQPSCASETPCCRAAEYEADAIGIRLLAKACYDPNANVSMLHTLSPVVPAKPLCRRAAEYEADAIGIRLLAKACYDPDANVSMLQKLHAAQGGAAEARMPEFLSTHPLTTVR